MYCAVFLVQLVMIETGKEPAREILHSAEREIFRCNYESLSRFKTLRLN